MSGTGFEERTEAPPFHRQPEGLERAPLAYENLDFLNSHEGRPLRILAEYMEPLARFERERVRDTVVFFGSARFGPGHAAMGRYYEEARELAGMLTRWSMSLPGEQHRFVVTSGGGPGIMEAANRGAWEAGGKTIGLNIKLPHEQAPNPYITPELNLEFGYFFMRKFWFAYLAKALVVFPGGFGTLDELLEIMTLAQTQKLSKNIPILIYGRGYWEKVLDVEYLIECGAVSAEDRSLMAFAETPGEAFLFLKERLEAELKRGETAGPDIAHTRS